MAGRTSSGDVFIAPANRRQNPSPPQAHPPSAHSHGVAGTTGSGLDAARKILDVRTCEILTQRGPSLAVYPSEDVSQWPEGLRRKMEPLQGASRRGEKSPPFWFNREARKGREGFWTRIAQITLINTEKSCYPCHPCSV